MSKQHPDARDRERQREREATKQTPPTPQQQVEAAQRVLDGLEQRRKEQAERVSELTEWRQRIAYSAHASFDAVASKEISDVREALIAAEHQVVEIDAAISTAKAKLVEAQQAREADKAEARELRKAVREFVEAGVRVDHALGLLARDGHALTAALAKVHTLGAAFPSTAQMDSLGHICLRSAIMQTPWARSVETVPPGQRRSFRSLIEAWASIEQNNIKPRLGQQTNNEAA